MNSSHQLPENRFSLDDTVTQWDDSKIRVGRKVKRGYIKKRAEKVINKPDSTLICFLKKKKKMYFGLWFEIHSHISSEEPQLSFFVYELNGDM